MAWANWFSNLWGKRSAAEIKEALIEKEPTAGYAGQPQTRLFGADLDDIPLFTLWRARQMLRDPVVSFGLAARNALLSAAEIEVTSKTAGVKEYIGRLFSAIWEKHSPRIGETKQWGYGGFQLLFKENAGILEIEGLKDFDPYDIRAEELEGKICGFTVKANAGRYAAGDAQPGAKKLYAPRALWTTYKSRAQNAYGESMLRNAYSPWYEKWMNHGAKRVIRQRMIKDAYRGDMIRFPMDRKVILPNGDEMSWKSVAQEVVENIMAGGTLVLPKVLDRDGRDLVDYTQAKDTGNPEAIWRWNEEVNRDIWYGLETPKEIIEAASSGSGYSGRSIPFVIALSMAAVEFAEYLKCFDRDVFRPLVALQFGLNVQYDVKPKDLIESFAKKLGGSQMGGASVGGNAQEPPPPPAGQPARPPQIPSGPNDNGQQPQQFSEPAQFAEGPTPDPFADLALQNAAEYIAKVLREMTRNVPENLGPESLDDLLAKLDALLARYTPEITKDLSDAQLAAMLAAHANVAEQIAKTGHAAAGAMGLPAAPPASLIKEFSDGSGFIRFPVVEDAIETLRASPVFAGETWRETAEAVKQGAFGITADLRADTLSKVREALSEQLEDGLSRAEFVENAHAIIGRGMLSDSHLAQVFRNNVGQSLADARERALSAPLVVDAFPYRQRVATHDNRVRPEHRALETQGLNGTAIYRADDPAWRALRAPFSWNCRCDDIPVGVADAAAAGVREAQEWLKRAEALADEKGGARALYFAETAPQRPEHVPWPTFEGQQILPAEGWERDQFDDSEASSGGTWITIGGQPEGDKKHKGGFPVQISSEGVILKGGPKALRGKHVSQVQSHFETERKARKEAGEKDAFGKVGDFFDKAAAKARKELDRHEAKAPGISKNFDKIAEYQGHKWDIPAKEYAALARELYPQIHQHIQERNDARAYASTRLKVWKSTASAMENRSGKQGQKPKGRTDYTQGGFDVVGRELAKMFPSLGWGSSGDFEARDSEADYAALTWELIKEEKQNPSIVSREFHAKVDDYLENHFKTAVASHGKPSSIDLEEYDPDQFAEGTHHAPSGGITIGGTFYKGGEFVPGEVVAKATKEERAKLERGEGDKPAAEPHTLTRHEFHKQEKEKAGYDPQATNKAYWGHVRAALEAGKEVPEHVKEHYAEVMGGLPEVKEKPKGHDKTFPTAGDVMKAGGTYGDYERPISQAYLNEEIDADHPAYQAISKNPLTAEQFDRNKRWLGQHVAAGVSSKTFGTITDVTPDGKSFIVTDAEGNTSTHSPQYTEHVGALIEQKLATGGNASKELDYIAPKIAAEYVANGENVSAAMKRHGLPHLNAKIRTRITEEADKIRAEANKPSDARAAAMAKREATDKAAEPAAADSGKLEDKTLFKRSGQQFENLQTSLGIEKPVMGPKGAEAVRKALESRPGGPVIAALLQTNDEHTTGPENFTEHGLPHVREQMRKTIDGKFTREQLLDAGRWAAGHESPEVSRFVHDNIKTATASDGSTVPAEAHAYAFRAGGLDRLSKAQGKETAKETRELAAQDMQKALAVDKKPAEPAAPSGEPQTGDIPAATSETPGITTSEAPETSTPTPAPEPAPFTLTNKTETAKPKFEERGSGSQDMLFGTKGLPGERNLFATPGVPEDMVYKPKAPPEPEKPANRSKSFPGIKPGSETHTIARELENAGQLAKRESGVWEGPGGLTGNTAGDVVRAYLAEYKRSTGKRYIPARDQLADLEKSVASMRQQFPEHEVGEKLLERLAELKRKAEAAE